MMIYILVNSIYGPFLETTRYTTLLWSMIGLVCIYAQAAERRSAAEEEHVACESGEPSDAGNRQVGEFAHP
jgi:hypothetical protein